VCVELYKTETTGCAGGGVRIAALLHGGDKREANRV